MLLLCGCSTPQTVLDLSDKTAGNVSLLNKYLDSFTQSQQNLASQRIAIDAEQSAAFAGLAARLQSRMDAMSLAGMTDQLSLINNIEATSDSEANMQNQLLLVNSNETKSLEASQTQLKSYSKQLTSLSSTLSQLAENDSLETKIQSLITYGQAVNTDMSNAQSTSTNASQAMLEKASQMKTNSVAAISTLDSLFPKSK